jgi:DnaJ-class molecular chaperone
MISAKELMQHPERFKECEYCNGYGHSLKDDNLVCIKCGGSGAIRI